MPDDGEPIAPKPTLPFDFSAFEGIGKELSVATILDMQTEIGSVRAEQLEAAERTNFET